MNKEKTNLLPLETPPDETLPQVVKRVKGEMSFYDDDSASFSSKPATSGEPLYNEELASNKDGAVVASDKSVVMRVKINKNDCADVGSELLTKAYGLLKPLFASNIAAVTLPADLVRRVGASPHTQVFLRGQMAVLITEIAFDEPDPKVAAFASRASPEQLKYIKQYLDPDTIFQREVAEVSALLRKAKTQLASIKKAVKPKKQRSNTNKLKNYEQQL